MYVKERQMYIDYLKMDSGNDEKVLAKMIYTVAKIEKKKNK